MPVVPEGGYGVSVNPKGTHFPFIREVSGVHRLFADMYLGHSKTDVVLPLRISQIRGFTQPSSFSSSEIVPSESSEAGNRAEVFILDATDSVVFDSTLGDYRYELWSDRFGIHEWRTDTAICRIVQHIGQHDLEDVESYPYSQTLTNAILDERVSEIWPKKINKFKVNNTSITGDVNFYGGYNFVTTLSSTAITNGSRRVNSIFVAAEAGAGEGQFPGCPEQSEITIKRINQVTPDDSGSFVFTATDCIWLNREGTTAQVGGVRNITFNNPNSIHITNNCLPCCSCDDFMNTYRGIRRLYEKFKALGVRANSVRNTHQDNIDRWLAQKDCREAAPIKLSMLPYTVKDDSCVKIAMGVCNTYESCRGEYQVDITFNTPAGLQGFINPETVYAYDSSGYSAENYILEGTWPNFKAKWPVLEKQSLAKLKFDMSFTRSPEPLWDSTFNLLDGPNGKPVMTGKYLVMLDGASSYTIVATIFWTDVAETAKRGVRVERLVHKSTVSGVNMASMITGGFRNLGSWNWIMLSQPTSITVKPYTIKLKHDASGGWTIKDPNTGEDVVVYTGRLYADTLVNPIFVSKVDPGDYVTLDIEAKLNGQTVAYGTLSETVGLKLP